MLLLPILLMWMTLEFHTWKSSFYDGLYTKHIVCPEKKSSRKYIEYKACIHKVSFLLNGGLLTLFWFTTWTFLFFHLNWPTVHSKPMWKGVHLYLSLYLKYNVPCWKVDFFIRVNCQYIIVNKVFFSGDAVSKIFHFAMPLHLSHRSRSSVSSAKKNIYWVYINVLSWP